MTFPSVLRRAACAGAFVLGLGATHQAHAATFTVTNTSDSGAGSLRQAILDANADATVDTIDFSPSITGTIVLSGKEIVISQSLNLQGPGAKALTISGNNTVRLFNINQAGNVAISGLSLTGGNSVSDSTLPYMITSNGGAIVCTNSNLSLSGCVLSNSTANTGGALVCTATSDPFSLKVTNCTFDGNSSMFRAGALYSNGFISQITGTTFSNNQQAFTWPGGGNNTGGGAIYNERQPLTLTNCTLSGNSASTINSDVPKGGAIASASALTLTNCTITNNRAPSGGGVHAEGILNISNTILAGNTATTSGASATNDLDGTPTTSDHNVVGIDPQLGPLADNGGPTQTHTLLMGSPAIDAGATSLATDQRGVARDSKPDIGAYELVNTAPSLDPAQLIGSVTVGTKEIFTLTASDADGAADIREMWLLINERLSWNAGATLIYVPSTSSPTSGLLYLRRGDAFLAPIQVGEGASSSAVLDNGAVRVVASEVQVTTSGNSITLKLPLTIRDGLVGNNRIFGRVVDGFGATDPASLAGDNGYIRLGTYTVAPQFSVGPNSAPILSRLTPGAVNTSLASSGVAAVQTFSFAVKDDNGSGDLESLWFLAGKQRNWTGSATFIYQPRSRRLYLRSDDRNSFLGGGVIGTTGILENSQVRVDLSKVKTTIYPDGKTVGLSLPLQAKSGLLGQNKVWLRAQDNQGATAPNGDAQGYVLSGTWSVTQPTAPSSANALSAGHS